ncbi:MAG: hypothetical protein ACRYGR_00510 [Janthinobacterium lividum]
MSWADLKRQNRSAVFDQFGLPVDYTPRNGATTRISVKLHTKIGMSSDSEAHQGGAQVLVNLVHVVFNKDQLALIPLTPTEGARLVFVDYGTTYKLQDQLEADTVLEEHWAVSQI